MPVMAQTSGEMQAHEGDCADTRLQADRDVCASIEVRTNSPEETRKVAAELSKRLTHGSAIALSGDLGAGKTQFAQGIAEGLGIEEPITSPTFNLVLEYDSGRIPLRHFDLYRLENPEQLEDIDFYALTDEDTPGASLIEWADLFPDEMPDGIIHVTIRRDPNDDETRIIEIAE